MIKTLAPHPLPIGYVRKGLWHYEDGDALFIHPDRK